MKIFNFLSGVRKRMIQSDHKYNKIALDATNLFWRSVCSCAKKTDNVDGVFIYTHVIIDFLERVKQLKDQYGYKDTIVYFLFDNPKSKITTRQMIDEHYKSHRNNADIPKEFWDTLALLEMVIKCYSSNFVVMRIDHCEADDLVYPLIKQKIKAEDKLLLVSVDMDWSRGIALADNVHWFNYHTLFWHKEVFKEEYGFYPEKNKVKFFKTIRGDSSDDIKPAIPNMPSNLVTHIVNNYDDIQEFISTYNRDTNIPTQWKTKIIENRSQILSNYSLVDFIHIEQDIESYTFYCKENIGELLYWYDLLALPFETRMINFIKQSKDKRIQKKYESYIKKSFLQKAEFKRIKRFNV